MEMVSVNAFRKKTDEILKNVVTNGPLVLTSGKSKFVILSQKEYNSIDETLHLLSNPKNTKRLLEGIEQHKRSKQN